MKILFAAVTMLFSSLLYSSPLTGFVVFGDSLSDTGNLYEYMNHQLPLSPPYYKGRFTNGPVWIEYLVEYYYPDSPTAHIENYAIGGAGILPIEDDDPDIDLFTLRREVASYFKTHDNKANPNQLYIVWIGSNNYLALPDELDKTIEMVNSGIKETLIELCQKGAKNIMVVNLPDLGRTPAAKEFDSVEIFSYLSNTNNKKLLEDFNDLKKLYPENKWVFLDVTKLLGGVLASPGEYGITNTDGTCYEAMMDETSNPMLSVAKSIKVKKNDACTGYLFFDPVHPSGAAHKIMGEKSRELLDSLGVVFH